MNPQHPSSVGRTSAAAALSSRLTLPVIAAPMTGVSSPTLTIASCRAGIIGSFPATNASSSSELASWLTEIDATLGPDARVPYAVNLPLYGSKKRLATDLDAILVSGAEIVISSVGSPRDLIEPVHAAGKLVFADVASVHHAHGAIGVGVDGLILLTAGAGGYTGWANPFVFVRAVRSFYDGPIVLAGGISDGRSLWAARALGCDLGYLGTPLIPSVESIAEDDFKRSVVAASLDDIEAVKMPIGLFANTIRGTTDADGRAYAAGHTVHGSHGIEPVAAIVDRFRLEYSACTERQRLALVPEVAGV